MMNPSRTDTLINRIASKDASRDEFAEFERAANAAPEQWERLARSLRDEMHMRSALAEVMDGDAAGEIERAVARSREAASGPHRNMLPRPGRGRWSGWAAAAMIALAWTLAFTATRPGERHVPPHSPAAPFVSLTADEALDQYRRAAESEGRIIAELPAVLVESQFTEDGQLDVYFVRQFLERETIDRVYELAEDEHGAYVPVQVSPAAFLSTPSSL